jgi:hypothetical protein
MINDLLPPLLPHMNDPHARRALVEQALWGCPVLNHITWEGNAQVFTVNLIRTLLTFGECAPGRPAIILLLESVKEQTGVNHHANFDRLILQLQSPSSITSTQGDESAMNAMTPDQINAAWTFLLSVGALAASELKERWTLDRKTQTAATPSSFAVDLPTSESATPPPTALADLLSGHSAQDIERVRTLIEQQKRLIFQAKQAKLDADEEYSKGRIIRQMARLQQDDADAQIRKHMQGIEDNLRSLGLDIEKRAL